MKKHLTLSLLAASCGLVSAQQHLVQTFNWVNDLSSTYNGDPNVTMTFSASGSGSVTPASGITYQTPFSEFGNSLVLGAETPSINDVAEFTYTLSFSDPVDSLELYIWGHSPNDNTTNFSIAPSSVTDASSANTSLVWDGTTISTSSGGGGNAIVKWDGPISSLSFTTQTAGSGDSVGFQQIRWVSHVPEPSSTAFLAIFAGLGLVRRSRN